MLKLSILGVMLFALLASCALLYPLRRKKKLFWSFLPALPVLFVLSYSVWGDFFNWSRFQMAEIRMAESKALLQSIGGEDAIIMRLKAAVDKNPKDAKAWFLLGRVYMAEENWLAAKSALLVARGLEPENAEFILNAAETEWALNHAPLDEALSTQLISILKKDPNQLRARALLARDAYTRKDYPQAINHWEQLLARAPDGSEDAALLRQWIAKAREAS